MATRLFSALRQVDELISKAGSKGTLSQFVVNAPHQYGQPLPEVALSDVYGLITPERMREIVVKTGTAAACLNATLDFLRNVHIGVRNSDTSKKVDPALKKAIETYFDRPNSEDLGVDFKEMIFRDLFTLGYAGVEIEPDNQGKPANLWPLDGARLRLDFDEHGGMLGYNMIDAHGMPIRGRDGIHAWQPEEVIYFRRSPATNSRYGLSRIEQLFTTAVIEDLVMAFISSKFTESNVPYGVFDMGDISDDELKRAIVMWNTQTQQAFHKISLTSSKGMKWFPFNFNLKELEAKDLLAELRQRIMGIIGVTMNELGEASDVNKSNGYNLSFTFKRRVVEPMLVIFCETMTLRFLHDRLGLNDLELYFEPIDSRDELLESQIHQIYFDIGAASINEIRNERGYPNVAGGDDLLLKTASGYIPLDLARPLAQAQLDALRATVQAALAEAANPTGGKSPLSPPLIRPPGMLDRDTTPDGSGSSSVKILYPKIGAGGPNPNKARGPVEANQRAGSRSDQ
jgi:hypothetical protein